MNKSSSNLVAGMIERNNSKEQERKPLPRIFTEDFDKIFNEVLAESYISVKQEKTFDINKIKKQEEKANANGPKICINYDALREKYIPLVLETLNDRFFNLEMFDEKQLFEQCLPKINQHANPSKKVLWNTIEEIIRLGIDNRYIKGVDGKLQVTHLIDNKFSKIIEHNTDAGINI